MESPFKPDVVKGKVALITGGGSGIGFEISSQFGKHGASIAIMGRRKQVLDDAVSALRSLGIPVILFSIRGSISLNFCLNLSDFCFLLRLLDWKVMFVNKRMREELWNQLISILVELIFLLTLLLGIFWQQLRICLLMASEQVHLSFIIKELCLMFVNLSVLLAQGNVFLLCSLRH